jgi:hypothetical protein
VAKKMVLALKIGQQFTSLTRKALAGGNSETWRWRMKVGDLLSYTYYGLHGTSEHFGLFLRKATIAEQNGDWGDIIVLADGREQQWTSWQCEVINVD